MKKKIICFGEVLWDVFPDHKIIGGAPLNVAMRLNSLENNATLISAVGQDPLGQEIVAYLKAKKMDTSFIQYAKDYPTGEVLVSLDQDGAATYRINSPVAWDDIRSNAALIPAVQNADAFLYGSLASRTQTSKETLLGLLDLAQFNVFDVNLRPPHYAYDDLFLLMKKAHLIKFNDDELYAISKQLGSSCTSLEDHIHFIAKQTNTSLICVTKGAQGAVLFSKGAFYYHDGYPVEVADTVGAGDSFLAMLLSGILAQQKLDLCLQSACKMGALVASKKGATPDISTEEMETFFRP